MSTQSALSLAADLTTEFPPLFPVNGSDGPDYLTGWDLCVIGGEKLPGICEVSGPGIKLRRDPNSKPGGNGGKPVYHGLEEQEPKIKIIVWTQSQLNVLWGMRARLIPIPGVEPKNVSIDSPFLKIIGVTSIAIIGVSPLAFHASARCPRGLEMTLAAAHWVGAAKGHGKNVTAQPRRVYGVTDARSSQPAPPPTAVAGTCAPAFQPGQ